MRFLMLHITAAVKHFGNKTKHQAALWTSVMSPSVRVHTYRNLSYKLIDTLLGQLQENYGWINEVLIIQSIRAAQGYAAIFSHISDWKWSHEKNKQVTKIIFFFALWERQNRIIQSFLNTYHPTIFTNSQRSRTCRPHLLCCASHSARHQRLK